MMPDFDLNILMGVALALFALYLLVRVLYFPVRMAVKAGTHLLGGMVLLVLFNLVGSLWGFTIGVNFFSGIMVGLLGLPGLAMLILLRVIL